MDFSYLDRNVEKIRENIHCACAASGRSEDDVILLAATKYADAEQINYIHKHLGVCHIGENRVQHLLEHWDGIDKDGLNIHFIGSLQTNKVKYVIDKVCLIHSLDSERLAAEIDKQAKKHNIAVNVLVEINSGMEESKGGVMPQDVAAFCQLLKKYECIRLCGFMTMAPKGSTVEQYREYFTNTRRDCEKIWYGELGREDKPVFSMGMSDSYEVAIECGATVVRLGNTIFSSQETK